MRAGHTFDANVVLRLRAGKSSLSRFESTGDPPLGRASGSALGPRLRLGFARRDWGTAATRPSACRRVAQIRAGAGITAARYTPCVERES